MTDPLTTSVTLAAGLAPQSAAAREVAARREIFEKTQVAEDAVLRPKAAGRLSHSLRAALAARIAHANEEPAEAARFGAMITDGALAPLAQTGSKSGDPWLDALITFTDAVATNPRDMTAADIAALQAAGVEDGDIVRAAELNAFLAYHLRLVAGLRLLGSL